MDKFYQDIHILNWKTKESNVIRSVHVLEIKFTYEEIIIIYERDRQKCEYHLIKKFHILTID